jgi:Flp pilus assembly protein TadG
MIHLLRNRNGTERTRGQALVEFALTLPLFALFVMVVIQLSIVFIAYYSETRMARETARWVAINSDMTDLQVAQHVQSTMLPGLAGGTASVTTTGTSPTPTAGNPNPTYTPTVATVGRMTVRYTPCGSASSPCTHYKRDGGQTVYVEMSYDVGNLLFLPATFQIGSQLKVAIPTGLPAYRVYVMVE